MVKHLSSRGSNVSIVGSLKIKKRSFGFGMSLRSAGIHKLRFELLEDRRLLAFGTPLLDVAGLDAGSNPPDTVGEVGPNHYVQMVNSSAGSSYQIYDRNGTVVLASTAADSLGTGVCSTGRGDPVVVYDQLADRWMLTEFAQRVDQTLCI